MIPIRDNIQCRSTPFVSWGFMAVCVIIFISMLSMPLEIQRQLTYLYGMVPIRYSNPDWSASFGLPPDMGLSFLTSLFLHSGWLHILINMWFLWIFAKNIEDSMGHARFFVFYLQQVLQWLPVFQERLFLLPLLLALKKVH